jgi:hypothetical protein
MRLAIGYYVVSVPCKSRWRCGIQLQVVNSLSSFLEGHGSRVIDVEDDIEERELDLRESVTCLCHWRMGILTRSEASSLGIRHSAAILSRAPEEATLAAIMSSDPGG